MNKNELEHILEEKGVRKDAYSLYGGHPSERYVLNQDGRKWSVYYSERGNEVGKQAFDNEDAACRHLCDKLLRDSLVRQRPPRPLG